MTGGRANVLPRRLHRRRGAGGDRTHHLRQLPRGAAAVRAARTGAGDQLAADDHHGGRRDRPREPGHRAIDRRFSTTPSSEDLRQMALKMTLQVQGQQPGQDGVLGDGRRVGVVPAVGGPDGAVERGVGVRECCCGSCSRHRGLRECSSQKLSQPRKPYPSDVTDEEWAFAAPYLTLMAEEDRQWRHDPREVFNALRWIVPWRYLPTNLPPWAAVHQ